MLSYFQSLSFKKSLFVQSILYTVQYIFKANNIGGIGFKACKMNLLFDLNFVIANDPSCSSLIVAMD